MERLRSQRFEPLRELGKGSAGIVYEAFDHELGMRVALKTLRHLEPAAQYRLQQEFRALRRLRHPNIVTIHELISDEHTSFISMELVEGADFLTHVRRAPASSRDMAGDLLHERRPSMAALVNEGRLRHVLAQVAQALHTIHLAGFVHRDLKPSNILVTNLGRAVLMDFSIAVEALGARDRSMSGEVAVGTAYYMAPEQAAGDPPSPALDWYALGTMLYQAMCDRLPFAGAWSDVLFAKQEHDPEPPSAYIDGVPRDLEELCLALLARNPEQRPRGHDVLRRLGVASDNIANILQGIGDSGFVGRERELEALADIYRQCGAGAASCVFVRGAAGMGKSKLISRFLAKLTETPGEPVIVLSGCCYPTDTVPYNAFEAILDALSRMLLELPSDRLASILPEDAYLLPRMFPALRRVPSMDVHHGRDIRNLRERRSRTVAALRALLAGIAAWRVVVLCVDDLQWADLDSLRLLEELFSAPMPARLMFVTALRTFDVDDRVILPMELIATMSRLSAEQNCHRVEVGYLRASEQRELLTQLLSGHSDDEIIDSFWAQAPCSPLLLGELVRFMKQSPNTLSADLRPRVEAVMHRRISQLPDGARFLLEAIAIAGEPAPLSLLGEAVDQSSAECEHSSATLRASRMIRVDRPGRDPWLTAYHDKIREAITEYLPEHRRMELHQRLALAYERKRGVSVGVLALHWQAVGDPEQALKYMSQAAQEAHERLAFERAAYLYGMAHAVESLPPERERVLSAAWGEALALADHGLEAAGAYEQAMHGGEDKVLRVRYQVADNLLRVGQAGSAIGHLNAIAKALGVPAQPRSPRGRMASLSQRAQLSLSRWRYRARDESEIAARDLERLDLLCATAIAMGMADAGRGAAVQAHHLLTAMRLGEGRRACRAIAVDALFRATFGGRELAKAMELSGRALAESEQLDDPYVRGLAQLAAAAVAMATGRFAEAVEHADQAVQRLGEDVAGADWELFSARYVSCAAKLNQGKLTEVASAIASAIRDAERLSLLYACTVYACEPNIWRHMQLDRMESALDLLAKAQSLWLQEQPYPAAFFIHMAQSMGYLYLGDMVAATEHLTESESWAEELALPPESLLLCNLALLQAHAALLRGDAGQASKALAGLPPASAEHPLVAGRAALLHAAMAHRAKQGDRAQRYLRRALSDLERCGAGHYAAGAKFRLGQLVGAAEGRVLIDEALAWCRKQGIVNSTRLIDYLSPWRETGV